MSENLVRIDMNPGDTWRGITALETQGWNEEAIGGALAIPVRTVRKPKLLGNLYPPILDVMAKGSMPNDDLLKTIASASLDEQAEVWKAGIAVLVLPGKNDDLRGWNAHPRHRCDPPGGALLLKTVLSCRTNHTDSGVASRIAGDALRQRAPPAHGSRKVRRLPVARRAGGLGQG